MPSLQGLREGNSGRKEAAECSTSWLTIWQLWKQAYFLEFEWCKLSWLRISLRCDWKSSGNRTRSIFFFIPPSQSPVCGGVEHSTWNLLSWYKLQPEIHLINENKTWDNIDLVLKKHYSSKFWKHYNSKTVWEWTHFGEKSTFLKKQRKKKCGTNFWGSEVGGRGANCELVKRMSERRGRKESGAWHGNTGVTACAVGDRDGHDAGA